MRNKCVKLVQTSRYGWRLESPTGKVMIDDLSFTDSYKAENWVRSYVSSWNDWSFELKPKEIK